MRTPRALLLASACAGLGAGAAEPKSSKPSVSQNGIYEVRMVEPAKEVCRLEVLKENATLWQLEKCVGNADDIYFISNDASRFWVLKSTPEKPGPPKGKNKGTPWYQVPVAQLYDREGNLLQSKRLMDLVLPVDRAKVRQLGRHFIFLEGVGDIPGKRPRVNGAGQVEFEVTGTRTHKLNF